MIAATNRDLSQLCATKMFREDLFFRLNVFPIECPPLRKRIDDLPILVKHFTDKFSKKAGKKINKISQKVINSLTVYHWPGDIRELENVIERAVILSTDNHLCNIDWLPDRHSTSIQQPMISLDELQINHIKNAIKMTNGRISGEKGAAKLLGISRTTLLSRMKKFNIKVERKTVDI